MARLATVSFYNASNTWKPQNYTVMCPSRNTLPEPLAWILDIDGTLMPSQGVDNECYWKAVDDCIGGAPETIDLHGFSQVSDSGILTEWMQSTHRRFPGAAEVSQVKARFLELTRQAYEVDPAAFTPTHGLSEWLSQLLDLGNQYIAIATGGWEHTARFKLEAAGLDRFQLPLASGDDHSERTRIMEIAYARLAEKWCLDESGDSALGACYVGDGPWDVRASQQMGWAFVGIARGARADTLRNAGASQVFSNFLELMQSNPYPRSKKDYPGHAIA